MNDFILYKEDGKVTNEKVLDKLLEQLKDGKYLTSFKSIKKRTLPQNDYYWGCVVPMVAEGLRNIGYSEIKTNDDAHEVLKHLFLKKRIINQVTEEEIIIAGSTADLKTVEFNAFLEDIWQWAASYLSINIPAPGQQTVMFSEPIIAEYKQNDKITLVQ